MARQPAKKEAKKPAQPKPKKPEPYSRATKASNKAKAKGLPTYQKRNLPVVVKQPRRFYEDFHPLIRKIYIERGIIRMENRCTVLLIEEGSSDFTHFRDWFTAAYNCKRVRAKSTRLTGWYFNDLSLIADMDDYEE